MPDYASILSDYKILREGGMRPKEVLRRLSNAIRVLEQVDKEALAADIRKYEGGTLSDVKSVTRHDNELKGIRPLKPKGGAVQPLKIIKKPEDSRTYCWQCGNPNRLEEAICIHCGAVLQRTQDASTKQLDADGHKPEYFGPHSVVLLRIRDANEEIHLEPQQATHELILGRKDDRGVVSPDVDLSVYGAADLGVSRMHMSLFYDDESNLIQIADMDSANGVYVNGQRLVSKEKRALRDGDQLRLGELVINVFFQHNG